MWRRARYLPLVAALAAIGWVAAPALSVEPYLPAAEDFEQRLPAVDRVPGVAAKLRAAGGERHAHADEGPVSHRSGVIDAPKRFDLVGLAGELRHYELRARTEGNEWSEWVEAVDGNPVYFGGADEVQLRTRGWRPTGRLHYVNVSGTSTATGRLLNGARGAINSALVSAASIVDPAANASPPRPRFVSRRAWGANRSSGGCPPRRSASYGEVRAVAIHHTVTSSSYTEQQAPGIVLGICRYHRNANGWNDIGYNALTDRFGNLYVGRAGGIGRAVIGAHAAGFNAQTTGIAAIGTHTSQPVSAAARRAFARYIAWKTSRHNIPVRGRTQMVSAGGSTSRYPAGTRIRSRRVIGHRRVSATACPGNALRSQIKQIRRRAVAIRQQSQQDPEGENASSGSGEPILRVVAKQVRPATNRVRPGQFVRYRVRVRNRGDAVARRVRICLTRPDSTQLWVGGKRCRRVGRLAADTVTREVFRVRPTERASGDRLVLRFVARSPNAENVRGTAAIRVR
jgi:hypothetical protein